MEIYGLYKLTLLDYPGLMACSVFTGGCNFRCGYCYNDTLVFKREKRLSETEILSFLKKRKGILEGVCISGGEPTLQEDLPQFIAQIKGMGFKVKLDTNGTNPEMLIELYKNGLLDYVAMDVKTALARYKDVANADVDIEKIRLSIETIIKSGIPYEFRTTLVEEYHDESIIREIASELAGAKQMFLQKFLNCRTIGGTNGETFNVVDVEKALNFRDLLKETIENVELRGY